MWFAGHEFYVDERVLVPRSPIAELIEGVPAVDRAGARPADARHRHRLGLHRHRQRAGLSRARVDATDVSAAALAVARINIRRTPDRRACARCVAMCSMRWGERYDVIVSNPPYVGDAEMAACRRSIGTSRGLALQCGRDGLDVVRRILRGAGAYLEPHGILIVEVGNPQAALVEAFPEVPFTWLEFERGGGGVFLLTREQLLAHRAAFVERSARRPRRRKSR